LHSGRERLDRCCRAARVMRWLCAVLPAGEVGCSLWVCPVLVELVAGWLLCRVWCGVVCLLCGQVVKGTRWMPWHQEPMKDVGGCDKPRGVANQTLIRGCPNGET
jgi:hypothetical protein